MATRAPNILFIMADQLGAPYLSCYGHPVVRTPHVDSLAARGALFDNAYTNSPLCAPSRFVMMSGRLPARIGAWDNAAEFPAEVPTFAHYLAARGYRTALSGKMHFVGPDQRHGFADRLTTDVYPADFAWHPVWDRPDEPLDWYHTMRVVTEAGVCVRGMYLDYDDEVVFQARRYLFERARDADAGPFALVVSLMQPHDPYLCRQDRWDRYRADDIDLPVTPHGSVPEDPHSARLRRSYGAADAVLDERTVATARHAYYGAVSDVDDKVGEVLAALAEAGLADDTVVVFTSDHGDMLGERGLWFKMSFFEPSARVPLIVCPPGRFEPHRVPQAVSLVDVLPTLVELAGDGAAGGYATPLEGRSLAGHVHGDGGHDEVIGEYFGEGAVAPVYMIRRGAFKFVASRVDPPQLYDLDTDPHERHNLAGEPGQRARLASLRAELAARYDDAALTARVLESQHRRALITRVNHLQGVSWDYTPAASAADAWVRTSQPVFEFENRARFPRV